MERFFNTAGPNRPNFNYTLDPLKRFDLELKILRGDLEKTIEKGLQQTWEYMDISGGVEEGHPTARKPVRGRKRSGAVRWTTRVIPSPSGECDTWNVER